jgi:hypothetical protein
MRAQYLRSGHVGHRGNLQTRIALASESEVVSRGQDAGQTDAWMSGVWGTLGVPVGTCRQPGELSAGM